MKLLTKLKYKLKYYIFSTPQPQKWVFIAGCSNSGTTLLHSILSRHPLIGSLPDEGQFCTNQLPLNRNAGPKRLWAIPPEKMYLTESDYSINVVKLKKQWSARFNYRERPILLEKSPPNTVRLRWLQANFSNAYFIGIHRNGYAVAEGIHRKVGHPLERGAQQWSNANKILLEDFEVLQNKILISYEKLTEEPETILNEIYRFLGITPSDEKVICQSYKIQGKNRKIVNLNPLSFNNLSKKDLEVIEREARDMLIKLNYHHNSIIKEVIQ
jgi:hypothetical protein